MRLRLEAKIAIAAVLIIVVVAAFWFLIKDNHFDVLQPAGQVAEAQKKLIIFASLLSAVVVIPVFAMTFYIVWKYRVTNTKPRKYQPEWHSNRVAEIIWWGIPIILISIIGTVTWISSHQLDPYRPLDSTAKPVRVQVVALDWKWLFIYPDQGVASVNYLAIPTGRPINFEITSDAPMNTFWIPKLGGQVYAMSGMSSQLHLEADMPGDYTGKSANINGDGYAGMTFTTHATSDADFATWVAGVKATGEKLTNQGYLDLAKPSENVAPIYYSSLPKNLYDTVVMKYMMPGQTSPQEPVNQPATQRNAVSS